jgi:hypothetical protein
VQLLLSGHLSKHKRRAVPNPIHWPRFITNNAGVSRIRESAAFCFSKEQMKEVIQASAHDHSPAGKPHDLADGRPVTGVVTVVRAMFASRLGIHGAMGPLDEGVGQ